MKRTLFSVSARHGRRCNNVLREVFAKQKFRSLTTALMLLLVMVPAFAQSEADFEVKQNADNTITITGYKGTVKDVVIPGTLYGLRVTLIGGEAFVRKGLTSVVIPDSVVTIGIGAFAANNLKKVTLGKGLKTIEGSREEYRYGGAFTGNEELTEIVIPDSVTSIGRSAFSGCGLIKVTFGKGLQTIGWDAFRSNKIAELNLPAGLKKIERNAFRYNEIRILIIPNSVTSIDDQAFNGNPIEVLTVPALNWPMESIFVDFEHDSGPDITCITLPANMNERSLERNIGEAFANFYVSQKKAAGSYIRRGPIWTKATAAEAAQYTKEVQAKAEQARKEAEAKADQAKKEADAKQAAQAAFAQAVKESGFTVRELRDGTLGITGYTGPAGNVIIPQEIGGKTVTYIEQEAFTKRVSAGEITGVVIPDTVTEIAERAFSGNVRNSKLAEISWGKGLKRIRGNAFAGNPNLTTIYAGTSSSETRTEITSISESFQEAWRSGGGGKKYIYDTKIQGWKVDLPAALVQALEKSVFTASVLSDDTLEITGYTGKAGKVTIPKEIGGKTVTRIGNRAFINRVTAGEITGVVIPDTVTEIGDYAFANLIGDPTSLNPGRNSRLAEISWGKGLQRIGAGAFAENGSLKTITAGTSFQETVRGDNAFKGQENFGDAWSRGGAKKYTRTVLGDWK